MAGLTGRARVVVLVAAAVLATWLGAQAVGSQVAVDDATATAQQQAAPLARVCAQDPGAAIRAGADCAAAVAVAQGERGATGATGAKGDAGVGVLGTRIDGGRLIITYSDGRSQDVGPVVGKDGEPGPEGRGITGTSVTAAGRLVVSYTDGTTTDLGPIVGRDGRGIASFDQSEGRLIVVLTDGSRVDAGPLPPGPAGRDGDKGDKGDPAPVVRTVTRNYTDGSVERCERTGGTDVDPVQTCTRTPPPDPPADEGGLINAG